MAQQTSVRPTELGEGFRALADILDGAPSILTATKDGRFYGSIQLTSPEAVVKAAQDLGVQHYTYGDERRWTSFTIEVGPMYFSIAAEHPPVKELHRRPDVTAVLEEQADAA